MGEYEEKYDRILYTKDKRYYFDRVEGSRISRVNPKQRKVIIDGLLDETVKEVKRKNGMIYYD